MLTVADVLQHPLFDEAEVVAGHTALHRQVMWVHNAAVPDAPYWLDGGELALTTLFNMPASVEEQQQYIRNMADKGVAALVITTGDMIKAIPHHLCEVAEMCGLPLIALSYKVRFVEIAKAINQRIAQENMENLRRALAINETLTRTVLEGGGMADLARQLARLLNHSISIETDRFEAIATENIAEVDEARRYTQQYGRTDPRLVTALEERDVLPRIRETLRPVHIPPMPDVGLGMERILAPVVVHGEIYGYMWIIADDHSISDIDMMAIESGATIAALMILYQESIQSAEASLKGSLLNRLIQGDSSRDTVLVDQSLRYGVDLRLPYIMMLVECDSINAQQIYRRINQMIATSYRWQAVVGQFAGQVVILTQAEHDYQALAHDVQARVVSNTSKHRARVSISREQQGIEHVKTAYHQCLDALHIMHRLKPERVVIDFAELGYLHALYQAGSSSLHSNPYVPMLRKLLDEKQADLFNTLEAYLDAGGNGVSTAEELHIHRSTLNYRLTRITTTCQVDLQDPIVRMNLQVALKLMRLFEVG